MVMREPKGKLIGYARIMLGDQLQLTGIRIYEGCNGKFVSYPNDPGYKGEDYKQLYYPVTRELREAIEEAILAEYNTVIAE